MTAIEIEKAKRPKSPKEGDKIGIEGKEHEKNGNKIKWNDVGFRMLTRLSRAQS